MRGMVSTATVTPVVKKKNKKTTTNAHSHYNENYALRRRKISCDKSYVYVSPKPIG
jgi:hypothetical protein